jgi:hypothetical protein
MPSETRSARSGSAGTRGPGPVRLAENGVFSKEGEYWTIGYKQKSFCLKDSKGLGYLTHLLRHPATEFHALDLIRGTADRGAEAETNQPTQDLPRGEEELEKAGIRIASLGDAGEMLDQQAKADYRRRLGDLREELGEAKRLGSVDRAVRIETEIDALTRELSRAVGLGGRNHRAGSASERARQTINRPSKWS